MPAAPSRAIDLDALQREWNDMGASDPMWAVLTREDKRGNRWDAGEFFRLGVTEIEAVLAALVQRGLATRRGAGMRALDFGCGVGRLSQALAQHFGRVDGVDIAPAMIEAARRFNRHGERVTYHHNTAGDLARFADGTFDFVYSNMVLQHMPPALAQRYAAEFVRLLSPRGVAVFQCPSTLGWREAWETVKRSPLRPLYRAYRRARFGSSAIMDTFWVRVPAMTATLEQVGGHVIAVEHPGTGDTLYTVRRR